MIHTCEHQQNTQHSRFTTSQGWEECVYIITDSGSETIEQACESLYTKYLDTLQQHNDTPATLVFSRIHLTDIANQKNAVLLSRLYSILNQGAVSIVGQAPLHGGLISLHTYHIVPGACHLSRTHLNQDPLSWRNGTLIKGHNYQMLWSANIDGRTSRNTRDQTTNIFDTLEADTRAHDMNLRQNTIRTWVYVRDIDNHYQDMVEVRRDLFSRIGLIENTRYIASTGIEGNARDVSTFVSMDALSIGGLTEQQIVRMEAPDNMPPTNVYGVTFERGTRIDFGDRSHLHISGTASIDAQGQVMHIGNAGKQTERTLENIEALLSRHNATFSDMGYLYVYLRDPTSRCHVREVIQHNVPADIPILFLKGAVCRPEWLVEIEGWGRIPHSSVLPAFL